LTFDLTVAQRLEIALEISEIVYAKLTTLNGTETNGRQTNRWTYGGANAAR